MAKLLPNVVSISGKIDAEHAVINGNKIQPHLRRLPAKKDMKEKTWLKQFNDRTGLLNSISGGIREPIKQYNPVFYDSSFYSRMNKLLRKELVDNRFLLLLKLKGIDVHPTYPLAKLNHSSLTVNASPEIISFDMTILQHPDCGKYEANCYDFEVLLFTWDHASPKPTLETQLSPWLYMKNSPKKIRFDFDRRAGITQWVLFLRIRLAVKHEVLGEQYVEAKVAEGMGMVEVGSFDDGDRALWKERNEETSKREPGKRKVDMRQRKGVVTEL